MAASTQIRDREKVIDAVAEKIERNMILLGASGIEDKLQEVKNQIDEISLQNENSSHRLESTRKFNNAVESRH